MTVEPQYIESITKGSTVIYGNKPYRVQDDGKGFLHIIIFDGRRKKIAIKDVQIWFKYGSYQDWIFNQWWKMYPVYETFKEFAANERNAL